MGKKKKGAVCNNPVAMARAAGPPPISGPTIRDYLDRDRPSLEEAAGIIAAQHSRKESGALAAYEEQLNETYRQELKDRRSKLLGAGSSHRSHSKDKKKKKKKKARKRERSRSRSRSPLSTPSPSHSDSKHSSSRHDHSKSSGHKKRHHRHKHSKHDSPPSPRHSSEDGGPSQDEIPGHLATSSEGPLASEDVTRHPGPSEIMEVDQEDEPAPRSVLTDTPSSVSVSLHPLVVMNISDHFTRLRVQEEDSGRPPPVYGALLGVQEGRSIEICNSFELLVTTISGNITHDVDYFVAKEKQFKQVFTTMEFLGWYCIGDVPTEDDTIFHKQLCADSENSLLLKLNPLARTSQLPINLYESLMEIIDGRPQILYTRVSYSLATEEAERIGVDHIARSSVTGTGHTSAVSEQLSAQYGAVKMLHSRVRLVLDYLKAVQSGELPCHPQILREASALCNQLPVLDKVLFDKDFQSQTNEVLLVSYLAAITKGTATASEFVSKINAVFDRHGVGRRARGGVLF